MFIHKSASIITNTPHATRPLASEWMQKTLWRPTVQILNNINIQRFILWMLTRLESLDPGKKFSTSENREQPRQQAYCEWDNCHLSLRACYQSITCCVRRRACGLPYPASGRRLRHPIAFPVPRRWRPGHCPPFHAPILPATLTDFPAAFDGGDSPARHCT